MVDDGGSLRARLLGGDRPVSEAMVEALEGSLEGTETVEYRLTGSRGLVRERDGETLGGGEGGGTLLAATDRKLVFVVDVAEGVETIEIPYTDLKSVSEDGGLLRTRLVVEVWGRGAYRFGPRESGSATDVVAFASDASEPWQRAVAALQEAKQLVIHDLSRHIEEGDMDAAAEVRERIGGNVRTARETATTAVEPVERALEERVATVERELSRTRTDARLDRGEALLPEVRDLATAGRYDDARETLERARTHVETALRIARSEEFPEAEEARSVRERLDEVAEELAASPLRRAQEALDRANGTENVHLAILRWEHALACYRDALTAGWGTELFDGDTDALRVQIEWIVGQLVRLRGRLADRYESEGDTFQMLNARAVAVDRYESACLHLLAAERLASQYRAGDAAGLRDRLEWIVTKSGPDF